MDYNPIFSGTVFVSVFVHLFVLSGYNDDFDIYNAVFGKIFKAKMGSPAAAWDTAFLQIRGSGGYAPYAPTLGKLTKLLSGDFTFFNESIFR